MLHVDLDKFWKDDLQAHKDNCFSPSSPQVALGIRMSEECVYEELNEKGDPWLDTIREKRLEYNKRYNDKAEKIVGKRLLTEEIPTADMLLPDTKGIHDIFGSEYTIQGESKWLNQSCETKEELAKVLDMARDRINNLRDFILPKNWEQEKKRIYETYGLKPRLFRHIRGPVTLAMSIFGVENLIFLILDNPDLAIRFRDTISDAIFEMATIIDEEAGYSRDNKPGGFGFADDNCCLLTPEMYEIFGYPILKRVFEEWSPKAQDKRYQHSDSDMGHLLPILSKLDLTGCNFGPTLTVKQIREHMPNTRIDGQLAPFTFMRNDEDKIIEEVKRDCEMAKETRGLNLSAAGSINNGSLLTSMRAVMYAIQNYGRY